MVSSSREDLTTRWRTFLSSDVCVELVSSSEPMTNLSLPLRTPSFWKRTTCTTQSAPSRMIFRSLKWLTMRMTKTKTKRMKKSIPMRPRPPPPRLLPLPPSALWQADRPRWTSPLLCRRWAALGGVVLDDEVQSTTSTESKRHCRNTIKTLEDGLILPSRAISKTGNPVL